MSTPNQKRKFVKHSEIRTRAETKVEALFDEALDSLSAMNGRLVEIADELVKVQPRESGTVGLSLQACSKEGCRGCPHARWEQYIWKPGVRDSKRVNYLNTVNLDAKKINPVRKLNAKAKGYEQAKELIREAKAILKVRSKLVACFRQLEYASKIF